jgi:hypothetical protein
MADSRDKSVRPKEQRPAGASALNPEAPVFDMDAMAAVSTRDACLPDFSMDKP